MKRWGRGIATQALGELLRLMNVSGRPYKATATAVAANPASCRVLEKNGFVRESTVSGGFNRNALVFDLYKYALPAAVS